MREDRQYTRISNYIRIKEIDQNPAVDSILLNISASGAQIETTTRYRSGDLIRFSYIPPGPPVCDSEVKLKGAAVWNVAPGNGAEQLASGKVVWVNPHPDKANYFRVGVKFPREWKARQIVLFIIALFIIVAIGYWIVTLSPSFIYGRILWYLEKFLFPAMDSVREYISRMLPF